jgi:hypothetical protein
MASDSSINRKHLAAEVSTGPEMAPCSSCRNAKPLPDGSRPKCVIGARSQRCSECVRKGYTKCDVTLTAPQWLKLRNTRNKLRRELEELEEEEIVLLKQLADRRMKKVRLRKQLRLAENRTDDAIGEELDALEQADEVEAAFLPSLGETVEVAEAPYQFHDVLDMSPDAWAQLVAVPDDFWNNPVSVDAEAVV